MIIDFGLPFMKDKESFQGIAVMNQYEKIQRIREIIEGKKV